MKCVRCSAEIPGHSRFCLQCGTPVTAMPPNPTAYNPAGTVMPSIPTASPVGRKIMAAVILLALCFTGLIAWTLGSKLLQKAGTTGSGQLVQAPGSAGSGSLVQASGQVNSGPMIQAPGNTASQPIIQAPGPTSTNNADVMDYLKFVKQIELSKQQLIHEEDSQAETMLTTVPVDQLKKALEGTDDQTPSGDSSNTGSVQASDLSKQIEKIDADWNQLTKDFNSKAPPASCVHLRDVYLDNLGKIGGRVIKVYNILSHVQSDPSAALKEANEMKNTSADLDSEAKSADDELSRICTQFGISKDFDIKGDNSSSGGMGLFQ